MLPSAAAGDLALEVSPSAAQPQRGIGVVATSSVTVERAPGSDESRRLTGVAAVGAKTTGPAAFDRFHCVVSGSAGSLASEDFCREVCRQTGKAPAEVQVLYVGTPSYDWPDSKDKRTAGFAKLGCQVSALELVNAAFSGPAEMQAQINAADVILVGGGNTLFAMDRWEFLGLTQAIKDAATSGKKIVCGGSAGAICWFSGGHSDSADPDSFYMADYATPAEKEKTANAKWEYIRVDGFGLLPGLLCPHFDKTQSNGLLRANDFKGMLLRHPQERGIGLDNNATLAIDGPRYKVIYDPAAPGSVGTDGSFVTDGAGRPGVWMLDVVDGAVEMRLAPDSGLVSDLLRPAELITQDPRLAFYRRQNPADCCAWPRR
jgi:dipeptidase E